MVARHDAIQRFRSETYYRINATIHIKGERQEEIQLEQKRQQELQVIGSCSAGYAWVHKGNGLYNCSAGGHWHQF